MLFVGARARSAHERGRGKSARGSQMPSNRKNTTAEEETPRAPRRPQWALVLAALSSTFALATIPSSATAAFIAVYGGPTYTPGIGGFKDPPSVVAFPFGVAPGGTAVGYLGRY